jgi:hypothetical protein
MYHARAPYIQHTAGGARPAAGTALHALFAGRKDALTHAADLLGGARGRRLVAEAADRLAREAVRGRRTRELLADLLDLLALEHVHVPGSEEEARFAAIDPCDPLVEEICLLCDRLRAALTESEGLRARRPAA